MNKDYLVTKLVEEFQIFSSYDSSFQFVMDALRELNHPSGGWVAIDLIDYSISHNIGYSIRRVHRNYTTKTIEATFKILEERYNG